MSHVQKLIPAKGGGCKAISGLVLSVPEKLRETFRTAACNWHSCEKILDQMNLSSSEKEALNAAFADGSLDAFLAAVPAEGFQLNMLLSWPPVKAIESKRNQAKRALLQQQAEEEQKAASAALRAAVEDAAKTAEPTVDALEKLAAARRHLAASQSLQWAKTKEDGAAILSDISTVIGKSMKAEEELKVSAVKGNFGLLRAGNELPQESQLQPTLLFCADFAALEPRLDGIMKSLAGHPDGIGLCILDMDPDQCSKQELQIRTAFTGPVRRLTVLLPASSGLSSSSHCSFQLITMMALGGDSEAQEGKSMRARLASSKAWTTGLISPKSSSLETGPKQPNGHRLFKLSTFDGVFAVDFLKELLTSCQCWPGGKEDSTFFFLELDPHPNLLAALVECGKGSIKWRGLQSSFAPAKAAWLKEKVSEAAEALIQEEMEDKADSQSEIRLALAQAEEKLAALPAGEAWPEDLNETISVLKEEISVRAVDVTYIPKTMATKVRAEKSILQTVSPWKGDVAQHLPSGPMQFLNQSEGTWLWHGVSTFDLALAPSLFTEGVSSLWPTRDYSAGEVVLQEPHWKWCRKSEVLNQHSFQWEILTHHADGRPASHSVAAVTERSLAGHLHLIPQTHADDELHSDLPLVFLKPTIELKPFAAPVVKFEALKAIRASWQGELCAVVWVETPVDTNLVKIDEEESEENIDFKAGKLLDLPVLHLEPNGFAFAALLADGSVVAWGNPYYGGNCQKVQEELQDILCLKGSSRAFTAVRSDGVLVSWGDPGGGGDGCRDTVAAVWG